MGPIVEQIVTIYCDAYVNFLSSDDLEEAQIIFSFIQEQFLEDDCKYLFEIMFLRTGPNGETRASIRRLTAAVVNLGFKVVGYCKGKEALRDDPKVYQMQEKLDKFMRTAFRTLHEEET